MSRLEHLLDRFPQRRVLVLGDMVADEYLLGRPSRISREAPVLVLEYTGSFVRPGGATNTAYNLSRLGTQTAVLGLIGDDEMGSRLVTTLRELGIDTAGLIVDPHRPTSTKTRILARGTQEVQQQIVRIDRIEQRPVDARLRDRMIELTQAALKRVDAVIVSDYEHGVVSQEVIECCLPGAQRSGVTVTVDAHGDLFRFRGVTAATPNQPEAASTVGITVESEEDLDRVGELLLQGMGAAGVLITRGNEGVALYEHGEQPYRLPVAIGDETQVVDVTGAGDTVAAIFTVAVASGATMREAAYLSNIAGGAVVRRLGAATLTRDELVAAIAETRLPPP